MDTVLLVCEVFIALFGIFSVIIADNMHERLHGLFVVGLALEGFLSHALEEGSMVTAIVLITLTVIALLMILLSFHSLIEHLRRYFHHSKNPDVVPKKMALTIDDEIKGIEKDIENDIKNTDLQTLIHEKFDRLEKMIDDKEKYLLEREKRLEEREKALEIAIAESLKASKQNGGEDA
ncbi:MAG: hypothetical protein IJF75_03170 [Clostridia bacterium]|nr:hypothetical protein [Clostridia bacterium]